MRGPQAIRARTHRQGVARRSGPGVLQAGQW